MVITATPELSNFSSNCTGGRGSNISLLGRTLLR